MELIRLLVITDGGHTYDFMAIAEWLITRKNSDPNTRLPINTLTLNRAVMNNTFVLSPEEKNTVADYYVKLSRRHPGIKLVTILTLEGIEELVDIKRAAEEVRTIEDPALEREDILLRMHHIQEDIIQEIDEATYYITDKGPLAKRLEVLNRRLDVLNAKLNPPRITITSFFIALLATVMLPGILEVLKREAGEFRPCWDEEEQSMGKPLLPLSEPPYGYKHGLVSSVFFQANQTDCPLTNEFPASQWINVYSESDNSISPR